MQLHMVEFKNRYAASGEEISYGWFRRIESGETLLDWDGFVRRSLLEGLVLLRLALDENTGYVVCFESFTMNSPEERDNGYSENVFCCQIDATYSSDSVGGVFMEPCSYDENEISLDDIWPDRSRLWPGYGIHKAPNTLSEPTDLRGVKCRFETWVSKGIPENKCVSLPEGCGFIDAYNGLFANGSASPDFCY